jgi:DNA-binding PadR family transcriptional regulator
MIRVSLKYAIIGFLCLEPMSGYTLQKRFEGSVASFWSVTQSQIYRELRGLEAEGLVTYTTIPGDGRPAQKVFSPTKEGLAALGRWLSEPVEPQRIRHPLLLKLSFSGRQSPEVVTLLLEEYARELASMEAEYRSRVRAPHIFGLASSSREALLWKLILDNGISWVRSEKKWAERALREWEVESI